MNNDLLNNTNKIQRKRKRKRKRKRNDGEMICDVCGQVFFWITTYSLHMKKCSQKTLFICRYCKLRFYEHSKLEEHKLINSRKNCQLFRLSCNADLDMKTKKRLSQDILAETKEIDLDSIEKEADRQRVLGLMHNEEKEVDEVAQSSDKKELKCCSCNQRCSRGSTLRIHLRCHTKDKHYSCEFCNKSFSLPVTRNNHKIRCKSNPSSSTNCVDRADQNKEFFCDLCSKKFATSESLREHKERHICRLCSKELANISNRNRHEITCDFKPSASPQVVNEKEELTVFPTREVFDCNPDVRHDQDDRSIAEISVASVIAELMSGGVDSNTDINSKEDQSLPVFSWSGFDENLLNVNPVINNNKNPTILPGGDSHVECVDMSEVFASKTDSELLPLGEPHAECIPLSEMNNSSNLVHWNPVVNNNEQPNLFLGGDPHEENFQSSEVMDLVDFMEFDKKEEDPNFLRLINPNQILNERRNLNNSSEYAHLLLVSPSDEMNQLYNHGNSKGISFSPEKQRIFVSA